MSNLMSKQNCAGAYPALWRIDYEFNQPVRRMLASTGETETVGHQRMRDHFDVVAISKRIAHQIYFERFAAAIERGDHDTDQAGPCFVCYVDAIANVSTFG